MWSGVGPLGSRWGHGGLDRRRPTRPGSPPPRPPGCRGPPSATCAGAAITRWLVAGLPINVVQTLAGHSDLGVTLRHYAKVRPGDVPAGEVPAVRR